MDRSSARSGRARIATGIVGGAIAVLLVSTSVLGGGGGFSGATTLRTGDDDVDVVLSDAATNGDRVAVGWQEERVGGPELFYRLSDDGGATFAATKTVDSRDSRERRLRLERLRTSHRRCRSR